MEKVSLIKQVRGTNTYTNVIDTQFREFITPVVTVPENIVTIDQFFAYYDQLFYDIPLTGINSHSSIIERSTQYLGGSVLDQEKQALIEEINSLRQQIIDLSQTYMNINSVVG